MIDEGPDCTFAYAPLTPRDYFAAHIATGLLSHLGETGDPEYLAEVFYKFADAMLKEREK